MSGLNEIITEITNIFSTDTDVSDFCSLKYGKGIYVKSGDLQVSDIPIKEMPVVIISGGYDELIKKRFLFTENEANLLITCGILQNDIGKAKEDLISLKELLKLAIKKDPLLNGKASYSTIIKSKKLKIVSHPLYFMELTMYVNYKTV
jgi:hypothetical protein